MSIPKKIVSEREEETRSNSSSSSGEEPQRTTKSDNIDCPEQKRSVRFQEVQSTKVLSSEEKMKLCLEKIEKRRQRMRSPWSPPSASTVKELQQKMEYLERKIQQATRLELALLNQSKSVREKRYKMVARLRELSVKCHALARLRAANNNEESTSTTVIAEAPSVLKNLPPVFGVASRRVSHSEPAVIDMTMDDESTAQ
jgi:hypothetical protein